MEKIKKDDVSLDVHPVDGFTYSVRINDGLFKRRYIGYSKKEAMQSFLIEARNEDAKVRN